MLARAPIPCFVQVQLQVLLRAGDTEPDVVSVQSAIAAAVNATGFTGKLFASDLIEAARSSLGGGVGFFEMLGRLRYPDGTTVYLRQPQVLSVPDAPSACVTGRTVQFFCDPTDVLVSSTSIALA